MASVNPQEIRRVIEQKDRQIQQLQQMTALLSDRIIGLQKAILSQGVATGGGAVTPAPGVSWQVGSSDQAAAPERKLPLVKGTSALVEQLGSASGWHDDGWAEKVVQATFMVHRPLSGLAVAVWTPSDGAPDGIDIQAVCNGATAGGEHVDPDTPFAVKVPITALPGDLVSLELRASMDFARPAPDVRRLAYVLKAVEFA